MAPPRRFISTGGLTLGLSLIPLLILIGLIARYSVNVPYFDEWSFSQLIAYYLNGGKDLGELFALHHEARMFFPTLLNLASNYLSGGDVRACAVPSLILAALSLFSVHRLASVTLPSSPVARMAVTVLASWLIFSPAQWENWLWGNQIGLFFPAACLTGSIAIAYSGLRFHLKLGLCAALAFVATYSFANGMLCWLVLPPLLVWQPPTPRGRIGAVAVWLAAAATSLLLYFRGYQPTAGHASWQESLHQPMTMLLSFAGFLGAPLSSGGDIWLYRSARLASLTMLVLLSAACIAIILRRNRQLLLRSLGWLTMCTFVLGTATVTALGRSSMSSVFLHDSRYTSFSLYLAIGLAGLLAVVHSEWPEARRRASLPIVGGLFGLVLCMHVLASAQSIGEMAKWRTARLQSKACLAMINVVDSPCSTTKLNPSLSQLLVATRGLSKLGLLHPMPLATPALPANLIAAPLESVWGEFGSLKRLADGSWMASGRATLPGREEPADAVVIAYEDATGVPRAVALSDTPTRLPGDVISSHWVQWFTLPEGAVVVRAYAYDALAGTFLPLAPAHNVAGAAVTPVRFAAGQSGTLDRMARGFMGLTETHDPIMLFGWAKLHSEPRPPDAILVTCEGEERIVGSGETHMPRPDVVRALGNDSRVLYSGFGALVDEKRLPAGGCMLRAWAYDLARHVAQPIDNTMDSRQAAVR